MPRSAATSTWRHRWAAARSAVAGRARSAGCRLSSEGTFAWRDRETVAPRIGGIWASRVVWEKDNR